MLLCFAIHEKGFQIIRFGEEMIFYMNTSRAPLAAVWLNFYIKIHGNPFQDVLKMKWEYFIQIVLSRLLQ